MPTQAQTLAELGARLDDWLDAEDIVELRHTLMDQVTKLEHHLRQRGSAVPAGRIHASLGLIRERLQWVDQHRAFALPFELSQALRQAYACVVQANGEAGMSPTRSTASSSADWTLLAGEAATV